MIRIMEAIFVRKNFGPKTWMYPMPVLIVGTYDQQGKPNAMNAAWGGIYDTDQVMLCLSHGHKTFRNIQDKGAFTVSMAVEDQVVACDYVGLESGNRVENKFEKAGFTAQKSEFVDAPIICQLPMTLECKLVGLTPEGIVVGQIVNVSADEGVLTDGKIDPALLRPITYDSVNHTYRALGAVVGNAFQDGAALK